MLWLMFRQVNLFFFSPQRCGSITDVDLVTRHICDLLQNYWKTSKLFNLWSHLQAVFPTLSYHLQRWNHPGFCCTRGRIYWAASGTKVPTKNPFNVYPLTHKPFLLGCLALPIRLLRFFSLSLFSKHISPHTGDFLCLVSTAQHLSSQNRGHSHTLFPKKINEWLKGAT